MAKKIQEIRLRHKSLEPTNGKGTAWVVRTISPNKKPKLEVAYVTAKEIKSLEPINLRQLICPLKENFDIVPVESDIDIKDPQRCYMYQFSFDTKTWYNGISIKVKSDIFLKSLSDAKNGISRMLEDDATAAEYKRTFYRIIKYTNPQKKVNENDNN